MLNSNQLKEFFYSIYDSNSIITGGVVEQGKPYCPVNCSFCICKGNTPSIEHRIPFISHEELLMGLKFLNHRNKDIYFGDGVSKLSAEAFSHPEIYELLQTVSQYFPNHRIIIMTTGVFIEESKVSFLNSIPNVFISLSINTLDTEYRRKLMPNPQTERIKYLWGNLKNVNFQLFDVGSNEVLKDDLETLYSIKPFDSFQLRRIEHTKYHNPQAIEISRRSIENYPRSVQFVKENHPKSSYWTPHYDLDRLHPGKQRFWHTYLATVSDYISKTPDKKYLFCSSESAYKFWLDSLKDLKNNVTVIPVPNHTYGGSITTAGLLTLRDVESAIQTLDYTVFDTMLLPGIMFNRSMEDLHEVSIQSFSHKIGVNCVALFNTFL